MIDIFRALVWLNSPNSHSSLSNEARQLIIAAYRFAPADARIKPVLERLRNASHSPGDPLEKAEILISCAAIGYWRGWCPQAAYDAREAVISYDHDDHRRAVALWILGAIQWKMCQNHDAYRSWGEARDIFGQRKILLQHFPEETAWYKNRVWEMDVELARRPEEILTWLNYFECSSLRTPTQQVVRRVQDKIRQRAYSNIYALMTDLQEANSRSEGIHEKAEIYLEFGLALYQMENVHFSIELLRKSVQNFYPGVGNYHKQVVARCMLGALEWMNNLSRKQAEEDWSRCVAEFENLRLCASRDNHQTKMKWYAEHHAILHAALLEQCHGRQKSQMPDSYIAEGTTPDVPPSTPDEEKTNLYQELLIKVRWDHGIADRLIEFERKKAPRVDRDELIRRAIERWIRDNQ
jgi:hypothetical protein